ncbi:hypothetical protein N479_20755 [Pseudoalteromonas luteoviolacea S4054]|uniref:Uncharacterized protein n=1 Tax=Pseudoalteromonas luteoviolacea S4054 TaxID=1129367 RepID=A0A0F6A962_9GAMM|nr:hypothetical protein N479_20755 [Pseudoalteromonas luteoviolacea S4054]
MKSQHGWLFLPELCQAALLYASLFDWVSMHAN